MTGALWATISGIGFGFFQAFNRRAGRAFDAYFSTFVLIAVSALILAGASALTEDLSQLNGQPLMMYVNFALAGSIHFFMGWTLLTVSQNKIGAARTGALSGTSPLFALFISALAFNEFLRLPVLGGILMLVTSVYLISFDKNLLADAGGRGWLDSLYGLSVAVCFSISPIFIRGGLAYLDSPLLGVTIGMSFSALAQGITLLFRRNQLMQGPLTNDAIAFGRFAICWIIHLDTLDRSGQGTRWCGTSSGTVECTRCDFTIADVGKPSLGACDRARLVGRYVDSRRLDYFELLRIKK